MNNFNLTLAEIRTTANFEQLKPCIKFLCDKMHLLTWGEFNAYRGTIESQCKKLDISLKVMNEYAEQYQVFGYEKEV